MTSLAEKRKRQRKLAILVVGSVFIGAVVLYFGFFKEPKPETSEDISQRIKRGLGEVKLNTDILRDRRLIELRPYTRVPTDIQTGRLNPFSPYEAGPPAPEFPAPEEGSINPES